MMLVKWLEPVIEQNCRKINDELIRTRNNKLYSELMTIIRRNGLNEDDALDIENIFVVGIRNGVETGYRRGLRDGISIYRK